MIFRLLHFHGIEQMDQDEVEEPIPAPKDKSDQSSYSQKKRKKRSDEPEAETQVDSDNKDDQKSNVPSNDSRAESPSDYMVDYQTLVPSIALECGEVDITREPASKPTLIFKKILPKPETVKEAVEISKKLKQTNCDVTIRNSDLSVRGSELGLRNSDAARNHDLTRNSDIAVQRLGSNPSISVRQLFPGEEELPLQGNVEFNNVKERTPEGWEKCLTTIQYDYETKLLWQELQKPYGNQSSFLRHLILLEKYFRNGDLILAPNASHHSVNYSESVQNRLRAYDNIPSGIPTNLLGISKAQRSLSGIITSKEPSVSIAITNAGSTNLDITNSGLASLNQGTTITNTSNKGPSSSNLTNSSLSNSSLELSNTSLGLSNANLGLSNTSLGLANTSLGLSNNTLGLANSLGLSSTSIAISNTSLGLPNSSVAITNAANIPKNVPITLAQLSNPSLIMQAIPANSTNNKSKTPTLPPGLMPLQPGTNRPLAPLVKVPQSQKIKFPITKNWRPNLIPIDPSKKIEKKPGLVQVISGGKPYHITVEDYKKMCAIKRTFDLRQKRLKEANKGGSPPPSNSPNSVLKSMVPRKGLMISKTSTITSESESISQFDKDLEKFDMSLGKEISLGKDLGLGKDISLSKDISLGKDITLSKDISFGKDITLGKDISFGKSAPMILPKIPKSLTVIPQSVPRKTSRPSSPVLQITSKVMAKSSNS